MVDIGWILSVFLMMVGAIGLTVLWLDLFTSVGYQARKLKASGEVPSVNAPTFLETLAGTVDRTVRQGGTVKVLHNGEEFLNSFLEEARGAQRTITATSYIWQEGEMHRRVVEVLSERARAGVVVRVLLDAHGSQTYMRWLQASLIKAGVRAAVFRPLRFGNILRFHRRSHRRAFVIDGRVGYTGGLAIDDRWLGNADATDRWRDYMFRVTGPLAHAVQSAFAELWVSATGEILVGEDYFPEDEPVSAESEQLRFLSVASSPSFDTPPLDKFWWLSIMGARQRVWVATPYIAAYKSVREALAEQSRRGVDVRLLLPGHYFDSRPIRAAGHAHYTHLLTAGVKIFEYQPAMMHSKLFIIDDVWSIIGSANLDVRSVRLNEEVVIGIHDVTLNRELAASFEQDLKQSQRVILKEWRQRGWLRWGWEQLVRLFEEQF